MSDSDLDKMIENLRKQRVEWALVDRVAKNGDRVVIDFEGFLRANFFRVARPKNFRWCWDPSQ